jgi:hypothetical protein
MNEAMGNTQGVGGASVHVGMYGWKYGVSTG